MATTLPHGDCLLKDPVACDFCIQSIREHCECTPAAHKKTRTDDICPACIAEAQAWRKAVQHKQDGSRGKCRCGCRATIARNNPFRIQAEAVEDHATGTVPRIHAQPDPGQSVSQRRQEGADRSLDQEDPESEDSSSEWLGFSDEQNITDKGNSSNEAEESNVSGTGTSPKPHRGSLAVGEGQLITSDADESLEAQAHGARSHSTGLQDDALAFATRDHERSRTEEMPWQTVTPQSPTDWTQKLQGLSRDIDEKRRKRHESDLKEKGKRQALLDKMRASSQTSQSAISQDSVERFERSRGRLPLTGQALHNSTPEQFSLEVQVISDTSGATSTTSRERPSIERGFLATPTPHPHALLETGATSTVNGSGKDIAINRTERRESGPASIDVGSDELQGNSGPSEDGEGKDTGKNDCLDYAEEDRDKETHTEDTAKKQKVLTTVAPRPSRARVQQPDTTSRPRSNSALKRSQAKTSTIAEQPPPALSENEYFGSLESKRISRIRCAMLRLICFPRFPAIWNSIPLRPRNHWLHEVDLGFQEEPDLKVKIDGHIFDIKRWQRRTTDIRILRPVSGELHWDPRFEVGEGPQQHIATIKALKKMDFNAVDWETWHTRIDELMVARCDSFAKMIAAVKLAPRWPEHTWKRVEGDPQLHQFWHQMNKTRDDNIKYRVESIQMPWAYSIDLSEEALLEWCRGQDRKDLVCISDTVFAKIDNAEKGRPRTMSDTIVNQQETEEAVQGQSVQPHRQNEASVAKDDHGATREDESSSERRMIAEFARRSNFEHILEDQELVRLLQEEGCEHDTLRTWSTRAYTLHTMDSLAWPIDVDWLDHSK